ncbi:MAG: hypothetical protein H7312_13800 [Tardiphaga sp.]|nr:hypothetical protein [Tardiphaga sp.]
MTPLYDVLSAQPSLDARQVQRNNFKLAMAIGMNRHYRMDEIVPRHFAQPAALAKARGATAGNDLRGPCRPCGTMDAGRLR